MLAVFCVPQPAGIAGVAGPAARCALCGSCACVEMQGLHGWRMHGPPPTRGVVQMLHGLGEHSQRPAYTGLAQALVRTDHFVLAACLTETLTPARTVWLQAGAGFVVYAHDHRGHGATAAAAGQARLAQRRAELQSHTLSELQRRATDRGTDNASLDAALDSKNPANALVDLLLDLEQGEPGVGEDGFFSEDGGWQLVVDDAAKVTEMIREREQQGTPLVLLGHSMGSMIGRTMVAQYGAFAASPEEFASAAERGAAGSVPLAGFICTGASGVADPLAPAPTEPSAQIAAMLASGGPRSRVPMSLLFGPWNDATVSDAGGVQHSENDWLSRDPEVGVAYATDPLCCVEQWSNQITVSLLADLQQASVRLSLLSTTILRSFIRVIRSVSR